MALEAGTYIWDLTVTNPVGSDPKSQGDDHLRLLKTVLRTHFPGEGIFKNWAAGNDTDPVYCYSYKSRGTLGSPSVITTADFLKQELVYGHDGTQFINAGAIIWQSTGTVATDRVAADWELWLHPDSTSPLAKVLRVSSAGVLEPLMGQIKFPATQNASDDANTLDDYEEGTWTPIDGSGAGLTFTTVAGNYTKIGNRIIVDGYGTYPTTSSALSGVVGGFPYATAATGTGGVAAARVQNGVEPYLIGTILNTTTAAFIQHNGNVANSLLSTLSFYFSLPCRTA